jgi:hypothetical protein
MNQQMMQMANALMQNCMPFSPGMPINPAYAQQNPMAGLVNALMNPQYRQQQLSQFQQQMSSRFNQFNPYEFAQQALSSGQMSQAQFEQYRAQANQIMGTNY